MKKEICKIIKKSRKIAITSHIRPDADCIGSGLALFLMLKQLGKDVHFCNTDPAPYPLTSLPGFENVEYRQVSPEEFDLFILVEGGTEARTGQKNLHDYYTINIDHHATSSEDGTLNWVEPDAAAVGELIYELGIELGVEFTRDIGFNLYAAISSDTGSFKYSNTTARSLLIASELVKKCNFSPDSVSDLLFNSNPYEKVIMIQRILGTLSLYLDNKVSTIEFHEEFLDKYSLKEIETEDVIALSRSIIGVKVSLFFKEIAKDSYRVSIRSRDDFNSQDIAVKYGGGGHKHAAGFFCQGNINDIKKEIVSLIKETMTDG